MRGLWFRLCGWRKGLPGEDGRYLFQWQDGSIYTVYYTQASRNFQTVAYHRKLVQGPLRPIALAVAFVTIGSLADAEPYTLRARYPTDTQTMAATNATTCAAAREALLASVWRPVGRTAPPLEVICAPGNSFPSNWGCIRGFNCK